MSLVEFMVALTISSFIMLVLCTEYQYVKGTYHHLHETVSVETELARIQSLIRNAVHKAGYTPCARLDKLNFLNVGDLQKTSFAPLEIRSESYFLTYRMDDFFPVPIVKAQQRSFWVASKHTTMEAQDDILLTDCIHGEIHTIDFIVREGNGVRVYLTGAAHFDYEEGYAGQFIKEGFWFERDSHQKKHLYFVSKKTEQLSDALEGFTIEPKNAKSNKVIITLVDRVLHQKSFIHASVFSDRDTS